MAVSDKVEHKEVEEHRLTHLPYRNWCTICVKAKGKDLDHRKVVTEDRGVSEYAFDYCFPGDEFGYKLTILAGRERLTGLNFATAVPTKGSSGRFAVDKALDFIEEADMIAQRPRVWTCEVSHRLDNSWAQVDAIGSECGRSQAENSFIGPGFAPLS